MNKSRVFKRAHELAKQMEGDKYKDKLSKGLKQAWKEEKEGENKGKKLLAKYRGLDMETVNKHSTLKRDYPAFFTDEPTAAEKAKTARNIADNLSFDRGETEMGGGVRNKFEKKFAKEKGVKKYRIRKHRDTEEYANKFFEYALNELEKEIN